MTRLISRTQGATQVWLFCIPSMVPPTQSGRHTAIGLWEPSQTILMSARYSGFYKAIQNAGAACAGQVNAKKIAFLTVRLIDWGLLILGVMCAIPVAWSVQETLQADIPKGGTGVTAQKNLDEMTSITAGRPGNYLKHLRHTVDNPENDSTTAHHGLKVLLAHITTK